LIEVIVSRLEMKPGDTLLVQVGRDVTPEMAQQIERYFADRLPPGTSVAVAGPDVRFSIVTQQAIDAQAPALG